MGRRTELDGGARAQGRSTEDLCAGCAGSSPGCAGRSPQRACPIFCCPHYSNATEQSRGPNKTAAPKEKTKLDFFPPGHHGRWSAPPSPQMGVVAGRRLAVARRLGPGIVCCSNVPPLSPLRARVPPSPPPRCAAPPGPSGGVQVLVPAAAGWRPACQRPCAITFGRAGFFLCGPISWASARVG